MRKMMVLMYSSLWCFVLVGADQERNDDKKTHVYKDVLSPTISIKNDSSKEVIIWLERRMHYYDPYGNFQFTTSAHSEKKVLQPYTKKRHRSYWPDRRHYVQIQEKKEVPAFNVYVDPIMILYMQFMRNEQLVIKDLSIDRNTHGVLKKLTIMEDKKIK